MRDDSERIRTDGLTKRFASGVLGLEALSLAIRQGELVTLFGGPGAGKSTALQIIAGLTKPTAGIVTIEGNPVTDRLKTLSRVTLIAGGWRHSAHLTPVDNLRAYVALNGVRASSGDCRNALRDCGVPDTEMVRSTRRLSLEHQLLIWFALARLKGAKVLLLDDPTLGLDVLAIRNLIAQIDYFRDHAATLLATSSPLLAARADRCVMLIDGRPALERPGEELTAHSLASMYVRLWERRDLHS